jgi:sulfite reductase (ferredoxin)
MAEPGKASKAEAIKENSRQLYGTVVDELRNGEANFSGPNVAVLKHHGTYQQDDRDNRGGGRDYMFMVRTRIPGGKLTAAQVLAELDAADHRPAGVPVARHRQGRSLGRHPRHQQVEADDAGGVRRRGAQCYVLPRAVPAQSSAG